MWLFRLFSKANLNKSFATITLNRLDALNAITPAMLHRLGEAAHGAALSAVTVAEGGILISCADDCSAATWDFVSDDVVDGVAV